MGLSYLHTVAFPFCPTEIWFGHGLETCRNWQTETLKYSLSNHSRQQLNLVSSCSYILSRKHVLVSWHSGSWFIGMIVLIIHTSADVSACKLTSRRQRPSWSRYVSSKQIWEDNSPWLKYQFDIFWFHVRLCEAAAWEKSEKTDVLASVLLNVFSI